MSRFHVHFRPWIPADTYRAKLRVGYLESDIALAKTPAEKARLERQLKVARERLTNLLKMDAKLRGEE